MNKERIRRLAPVARQKSGRTMEYLSTHPVYVSLGIDTEEGVVEYKSATRVAVQLRVGEAVQVTVQIEGRTWGQFEVTHFMLYVKPEDEADGRPPLIVGELPHPQWLQAGDSLTFEVKLNSE